MNLRPRQGLFISFLLLTVSLIGCSSRPALIDENNKEKNPYYAFYQKQDVAFRKKLAKSGFHLFRGTLPAFLDDVSRPEETQQLLNALPQLPVHGDFHVQQMANQNGEVALDDFDTVTDLAPVWIDLVRMETSARLVAKGQSLSDYTGGSCVRAYATRLGGSSPDKSVVPVALTNAGVVPKNFSELDAWVNAKGPVAAGVEQAIRKYFADSKVTERVKEIRGSQSGVGSFLVTKFLVLLESNKLLEFKAEEENPLAAFRGLPKSATPVTTCQRFLNGTHLFRPKEDYGCTVIDGQSFAVIPWSLNYLAPEDADFKDATSLQNHVAWMCSELAAAQLRRPGAKPPVALANTLQKNPVFLTKIVKLAELEASKVDLAYRLILNDESTHAH